MSVQVGKISSALIVKIKDDYIKEVAHRFKFTPNKGYVVRRTMKMHDGDVKQNMIVDNSGKYAFISPQFCVRI